MRFAKHTSGKDQITAAGKRPSLLAALGLVEGRDGIDPGWFQPTLQALAKLWPINIVIRAGLMGYLLLRFAPPADQSGSFVIGAASIALIADLFVMIRLKSREYERAPPQVQLRSCALAIWISSAAGAVMIETLLSATPGAALLVFLSFFALSALLLANLPLMLLACATGTIAALLALQALPQIWAGWSAVAAVTAMLCVGAIQARLRLQSYMTEGAQAAHDRRAALLLSEFEQSGQGWFWETDRHGCLTYLSHSFGRAPGQTMPDLIAKPFLELIAPEMTTNDQGDRDQGDRRTLRFHFSTCSAFRDIAVHLAIADAERWWSLSGTPIKDPFGRFAGFRGIGLDMTEMKRSEAEAARLARYDPLTGLSNRLQMRKILDSMLADRGHARSCVTMLLDLDRFKNVNDTLGHPAGDALLQQVSERLHRVVGAHGQVGRLGGDEFQVILSSARTPEALSGVADLAESIIANLSKPYVIDGCQVTIGATIGIAAAPKDGLSSQTLIRNADLALYTAKAAGRGVHRFFHSDMLDIAEDRRQLEQDLREALAKGELFLLYQPVVCAATEKITGFEALLRWTHPVRGPISPAAFIPIAEESGLIAPIGEWVLRQACHEVAAWPAHVKIAVNVSPVQFASPVLPAQVVSALAAAGLAPERLELEITESVFLNDTDSNDAMFRNLKQLGVRLVLDDFGTGYSSLGYLKKAPFDKIKIDRSFVHGAAIPGNSNAAIVKAIVTLAEALSMDTTAEGAETHDDLNLIRALGCSHIQGHIYGKAMSPQDALAQLMLGEGSAVANGFKSHREQRKALFRSIHIHHEGRAYPARIRNVSTRGALVEGIWQVPEGTCLSIELVEGQQVEAVVRWNVEDRCGLQFAQPVDIDQMMAARPTLRRTG